MFDEQANKYHENNNVYFSSEVGKKNQVVTISPELIGIFMLTG